MEGFVHFFIPPFPYFSIIYSILYGNSGVCPEKLKKKQCLETQGEVVLEQEFR
jgi:hypothetical protein